MAVITRYISYFIIAALLACGVWSCDRFDTDEPDSDDGEKYMLLLHVLPIDATRSETDAAPKVTERIASLRIIVLSVPEADADGTTAAVPKIEHNRLISGDDFKETTAKGFEYPVALPTTQGKKDVYLIANEASVGTIYGLDDASGQQTYSSFSAFLKSYEPGDGQTPDAEKFKAAVEAIYFEPKYTIDDQNAVYLPYTSHYRVEAVEKEQKENKLTMYLVPVATKFTFKFVNKRDDDVKVSIISVKGTDTHNFLLAHVGETDYQKDFDNETSLYWVDWLAKVSEATHNSPDNPDNAAVNEKYGWISDYKMPGESKNKETVLFSNINDNDAEVVPAQQKDSAGEDIPGVKILGPYYRPEGLRNEEGKDNEGNAVVYPHVYRLTLGLTGRNGEGPEFEDVAIDRLHALFRNTSVHITVTMTSGDVEVYAEIADWNRHYANGWVNNGDDSPYVDPDSPSGSNAN